MLNTVLKVMSSLNHIFHFKALNIPSLKDPISLSKDVNITQLPTEKGRSGSYFISMNFQGFWIKSLCKIKSNWLLLRLTHY